MGQVTEETCRLIIEYADRDDRFPLTVNEMRQLAYLASQQIKAGRRTTPDREAIELREAARQFYNMTNGDPMVRISAPSAEKRDAIYDAAKRLRALLELTAPTSDKGGA
ncbi:Uncharacterised protein [Burkholderia pseudomallei]|nr:Uncharacterised protein [Burkholderia pseudomallei]CAJ7883081.1 Uncharacterised protein [Burkholderia pseudomallei]